MSQAGGRFSDALEGAGSAANEALDDTRTVSATLFYISLALIFVALSTRHEDLFLDQALTVVKLNLLVKPSSFYTYAPVGYLLLQLFLYYKLMIARTAVDHLFTASRQNTTSSGSGIDALHPGKLKTLLDPRQGGNKPAPLCIDHIVIWVTLVFTPILVQSLLFLAYLPTHHYFVMCLQALCWALTLVCAVLCFRVRRSQQSRRSSSLWSALNWTFREHWRRFVIFGIAFMAAVLAVTLVPFSDLRSRLDIFWRAVADAGDTLLCGVDQRRNGVPAAPRAEQCSIRAAIAGVDPRTLRSHSPFPFALNLSGHTLGKPEIETMAAARAIEETLAEVADILRNHPSSAAGSRDGTRTKRALSSTEIDDYDDLVRLRGRNFPWLSLREARLHGLDLSYSALSDLDMTGAVLRKVVIRNDDPTTRNAHKGDCGQIAAMSPADRQAVFTTRMQSVIAIGVDWSQSTWEFADFSRSSWVDAKLQNIGLRCVTFFSGGDPSPATAESREGSTLTGADLSASRNAVGSSNAAFESIDLRASQADLARFSGRSMKDATFAFSSLRGASFDNVEGEGIDFRCADLTGASFNGAKLNGARFEGAILQGVVFDRASLAGAVFGLSADKCNRENSNSLLASSFRDADLTGAVFIGAALPLVDFQNATLDLVLFRSIPFEAVTFAGVKTMRHTVFMQQNTGGFIPAPPNAKGDRFENWWNGFINISANPEGTRPFKPFAIAAARDLALTMLNSPLGSVQRPAQIKSRGPEEWRSRAASVRDRSDTFEADQGNRPDGDWTEVRPPDVATAASRGREIGARLHGLLNAAGVDKTDRDQRIPLMRAMVALACYRYGGNLPDLSVFDAAKSAYESRSNRGFMDLVAAEFRAIGPSEHYLDECTSDVARRSPKSGVIP